MFAKILKFAIVFLAVSFAVYILNQFFSVEFGQANYWDHRGIFFLIFITFFPRLTMLFSSVAFGGFFWWVGWLFFPRFLVALLATLSYWNQNPILVVLSWLIAIGGESSEKIMVVRRTHRAHPFRAESRPHGEVIDVTPIRK